jgi:hypothetical protein
LGVTGAVRRNADKQTEERDRKLRELHGLPPSKPDSPDEPRTGVDFCAFTVFGQARLAARTTAVLRSWFSKGPRRSEAKPRWIYT